LQRKIGNLKPHRQGAADLQRMGTLLLLIPSPLQSTVEFGGSAEIPSSTAKVTRRVARTETNLQGDSCHSLLVAYI
jgi:hypothetical protein